MRVLSAFRGTVRTGIDDAALSAGEVPWEGEVLLEATQWIHLLEDAIRAVAVSCEGIRVIAVRLA